MGKWMMVGIQTARPQRQFHGRSTTTNAAPLRVVGSESEIEGANLRGRKLSELVMPFLTIAVPRRDTTHTDERYRGALWRTSRSTSPESVVQMPWAEEKPSTGRDIVHDARVS